jgi:hypothetical protein
MRLARLVATGALAGIAALGLAGCGEDQQVTVYKQGKYQGKPDTQPWTNAPVEWSNSQWTKGDRDSYETAMRKRIQGQNEYVRIGDGG